MGDLESTPQPEDTPARLAPERRRKRPGSSRSHSHACARSASGTDSRINAHPRSGTTRRTYVHGCPGGCYGDARATSVNSSASAPNSAPSSANVSASHPSADIRPSSYRCTTHTCAADARAAAADEHAEPARAVVHAQAHVHAEAYPDTAPDVHAAAHAGTHPTDTTLMWRRFLSNSEHARHHRRGAGGADGRDLLAVAEVAEGERRSDRRAEKPDREG